MRSHEMKDDEILRQYLLGTLNEEQVDEIERRLLADGELFELAEAVEGDLLAAAARGKLTSAERGRVLRRLAASPAGRDRLALARGLTSLGREPVSAEIFVFQLLTRPEVRAAAMAASLIFMAGGLWVATQFPALVPGTGHQITLSPTKVMYSLAMTTVRSAGGDVDPLEIPRGTSQVEIRLPLEPGERSTFFAVTLQNASTGRPIQHEQRIEKDPEGDRAIVLSVPSTELSPGKYEIEIRDEDKDLLGHPVFEVASNVPSR